MAENPNIRPATNAEELAIDKWLLDEIRRAYNDARWDDFHEYLDSLKSRYPDPRND